MRQNFIPTLAVLLACAACAPALGPTDGLEWRAEQDEFDQLIRDEWRISNCATFGEKTICF